MTQQVILIGGTGGVGKTTLARALSRRLDIPWISCDDLVQAAKAVTTPASHPDLHVMTTGDHVGYYTNTPSEQLIADAKRQHQATWPIVERVVRKYAKNDESIILEGWAIQPERAVALASEFPFLHSYWLHIEPQVLEARERNNPWTKPSPDPARMLDNFLGRSLWYNEWIRTETIRLDLPLIHQDGHTVTNELCEMLLASLPRG